MGNYIKKLTQEIGLLQKGSKSLVKMTKYYQNNITREEIDLLKVHQFGGCIHIIENEEDAAAALNILKKHSVIGFDTETKPNFKKGRSNRVSLIQLAISDQAFLFRIPKTGIPDDLVSLFEDDEIIKTGVAIKDDVRKLKAIRDFRAAGFLELQEYSGFFRIESNSLKKLAAIVLGIKISKSQQLTDWEAKVLTEAQQRYAATDAWACLEIYKFLRNSSPV
jgi:ribonuclease D